MLPFIILFSLLHLLPSASPLGGLIPGTPAKPGQFPYTVSYQHRTTTSDDHYCSGTIIEKQWVLTAAHCLWDMTPDVVYIEAGTTKLYEGGTKFNISKLIQHPDHDQTTLWHDIALVKIDGQFDFSETVAPIALAEVAINEIGTISGWGYHIDLTPTELEFTDETTLSTEDCATLGEESQFSDMPRGDGQVCAFSELGGLGACFGDNGGPLVQNETLVGVASYTLDDSCEHKYPDVFSRVSYYNDWIQQTIDTN